MADTINKKIRRLWSQLYYSSAAVKILWINITIFVLLRLAGAVSVISGNEEWIDSILAWTAEVPSDLFLLGTRPWTIFTYMFSQYEVWHALINMLLFYWFATIFLNISSSKRLWRLYLLSGLAGALCFIVFTNLFPGYSHNTQWLIGSSASVLGVIAATSLLSPDTPMTIFFIGEIKLKWIGLVTILLTLAGGLSGNNYGGNLAHVGGILTGVVYVFTLRFPRNIYNGKARQRQSANISSYSPHIAQPFTPRRPISAIQPTPNPTSRDDIEKLNAILDKIKVSGYDALTPGERKLLFEVSSRIK